VFLEQQISILEHTMYIKYILMCIKKMVMYDSSGEFLVYVISCLIQHKESC